MTKLQRKMVREQRNYEYRTMLEMARLICRKDDGEELDCMNCQECSCPVQPQESAENPADGHSSAGREILSSEMRSMIRQTMRFSGPRMMAGRNGGSRWELAGGNLD